MAAYNGMQGFDTIHAIYIRSSTYVVLVSARDLACAGNSSDPRTRYTAEGGDHHLKGSRYESIDHLHTVVSSSQWFISSETVAYPIL
jgi:hypothetical protein